MKARHVLSLGLGFAAAALLASCTTTYITPTAVADVRRVDLTAEQSNPASQKTFLLPHDWQYGSWVLKKGAMIVFYEDGTGMFNGTIFSHHANRDVEEVHLQSVQYGADGNVLFTFPGSDTGFPMHVRASHHDHIAEARFGYDKRHFPFIHDVKFYARARLNGLQAGKPINRRANLIGW